MAVTESVVLPPRREWQMQQSTFWPDQIDAHRPLAQVGSGRATANYTAGQKIYSQGENADFVFFIQEGHVQLTVARQHGQDVVIGVAQAGQFFGEACLLDIAVRVATATAMSDSRITSVTKEAVLSTIRERPKFAKLFYDYLSEHNSWVQKYKLEHLPNSCKPT
jgi:CRP/FNR family cyclic AMP-dependent transcriptional regulator